MGDEVDMVAGPRRQRSQQQCGVHRPVQARPAARVAGGRVDADAPRRRAAGVEHQHHPPVALGPPRPHHHVGPPRGGPPVDRPDVVADHVLAQRVELGALSADQHRKQPVDFTQLRQPRRQVLAGQKRRQDPDLPRHPRRALPARQAERPDRARGHRRRVLVAAARRPQPGDQRRLLSGRDVDRMRTRLRPRAGCPGVADLTLEPAPTAVGCYQHRVGGLPEACGDVPVAGKPQRAGACRQRDVDGDQAQQHQQREPEKRCRPRR